MKRLQSIAANELRDQLISIASIMGFAVLFGTGFLMTANGGEFQTFAVGGGVKVNSPYVLTRTLIILTVFSIFAVPAFLATAILKDTESKFDSILFSMPITKSDYILGRFIGGYLALMLVITGGPLGMLLGTFWPWADPSLYGPTQVHHYLFIYALILTPVMFVVSVLIFAVAIRWRSMLIAYVMALALLITYLVTSGSDVLTPLFDPFMYKGFEEQTRYWTAAQRNSQLISLDRSFALNRLIWAFIAIGVFWLALNRFSFGTLLPKHRKKAARDHIENFSFETFAEPINNQARLRTRTYPARQFTAQLAFEIRSIIFTFPFLVVAGLALFLSFLSIMDLEIAYGVHSHPHTRLLIGKLGSLAVPFLAIIIFFSAETISRDRRVKINELIDSAPVENWIYVFGKILALTTILLIILIVSIALAVLLQLSNGFTDIQPWLYISRGLVYFIIPYICLTILACFFQVVSKHRFIGMVLFGGFLAAVIGSADLLGVNHPLLSFGIPAVEAPLTDMNNPGELSTLGYWVRAYWMALAGIVLIATYRLWPRGEVQPLSRTVQNIGKPGGFKPRPISLVFISVIAISGGFIFYNTNILNNFHSEASAEQIRYKYEVSNRDLFGRPAPKTIGIKISVDLFPEDRRVDVLSTHILRNKTEAAIRSFPVIFPQGFDVSELVIDGGTVTDFDENLNLYRIDLVNPLRAGDELTIKYRGKLERRGFSYGRPSTSLVRNGMFLKNSQIVPYIGFDQDIVIQNPDRRKALGLSPLPNRPSMEDLDQLLNNSARQDSDFISFEATISTSAGQIALAPGRLERKWTDKDRQYFRYQPEVPIRNFFSVVSADYSQFALTRHGVDVNIYYHPSHDYNVERIANGAIESLNYFSRVFSPYQYSEIRIAEIPAYHDFAQSYPGLILYSEDIGFLAKVGEGDLDFPYFVTAHEVSHQWWGHQLTAANIEGDGFVHETLAQYSALVVFEQKYGVSAVQKLLTYERDKYLTGRGNDPIGERPLYRVGQQDYIFYRKGALAMYALRDQVGEEVINQSLRKLLELRAYQSDPYATAHDFLAILKEEAGPDDLTFIEDLFEYITVYEFELVSENVHQNKDGTFTTTLEIKAVKFHADEQGQQSKEPLDQLVDVGLFNPSTSAGEFNSLNVVEIKKIRLKDGLNTVVFDSPDRASVAAIDPYNIFIDRTLENNSIALTLR